MRYVCRVLTPYLYRFQLGSTADHIMECAKYWYDAYTLKESHSYKLTEMLIAK